MSSLWTGASMLYDRHNLYKQLTDYDMTNKVYQALYQDEALKMAGCHIEVVVFHRDVLLTGHVSSLKKRDLAEARAHVIAGTHRIVFNQLSVGVPNDANSMTDSWITAKIRSLIFADANIPPKDFKIVTVDGTVYIMGHTSPAHAEKVVDIARNTTGVKKIVKLMKYYKLVS